MFSRRSFPDRTPNRLAQALDAARAASRPLADLTRSNPTTCGFPYPSEPIQEALGVPEGMTYAPEPRGLEVARTAVADLWAERRITVRPREVLLTASTSEAYGLLFKLLCDPGDEVLAPQPSYPLFELLARLESVRLVPYPLRYDGAWHIDVDALRASVTPRTRAVLCVSPNNPTGSYVQRSELGALAELGLPLISDEVFGEYPLRPGRGRASSALELRSGLVFALDGLSKLAGLPQLKLGWVTVGGDPALVAEAVGRLEMIADTYLSVSTPVQFAAPRLLELRDDTQRAIHQRARRNLAALSAACVPTPATVLDVEGGWYAVVRLPAVMSEEQWVLALLDAGVVVQPGYFYDFASEAYVVVSLLAPEDEFRAGAARIAERAACSSR